LVLPALVWSAFAARLVPSLRVAIEGLPGTAVRLIAAAIVASASAGCGGARSGTAGARRSTRVRPPSRRTSGRAPTTLALRPALPICVSAAALWAGSAGTLYTFVAELPPWPTGGASGLSASTSTVARVAPWLAAPVRRASRLALGSLGGSLLAAVVAGFVLLSAHHILHFNPCGRPRRHVSTAHLVWIPIAHPPGGLPQYIRDSACSWQEGVILAGSWVQRPALEK
jgi:hypothetical protein